MLQRERMAMTDREIMAPQPAPSCAGSSTNRRRPWLAALLSLLAPGTGQIYNGEIRRGAFCYTLFFALEVAILFVLPNIGTVAALLVALFLLSFAIVFGIGTTIDAFRHARHIGATVTGRCQNGWIYLGLILVVGAIAFYEPSWLPQRLETYFVPSGSMRPTLAPGQNFLALQGYYRRHAPQRGDVVTFLVASDKSVRFVMRIIGLPGDRIQLIRGVLHINGQAVKRDRITDYELQEPDAPATPIAQYVEILPEGRRYTIVKLNDDGDMNNTPEYAVPTGAYFLLGDNRDNARDSRMSEVRFVPSDNLVARASVIYWPLNRLGTSLQ
jgi:signal peptidase I